MRAITKTSRLCLAPCSFEPCKTLAVRTCDDIVPSQWKLQETSRKHRSFASKRCQESLFLLKSCISRLAKAQSVGDIVGYHIKLERSWPRVTLPPLRSTASFSRQPAEINLSVSKPGLATSSKSSVAKILHYEEYYNVLRTRTRSIITNYLSQNTDYKSKPMDDEKGSFFPRCCRSISDRVQTICSCLVEAARVSVSCKAQRILPTHRRLKTLFYFARCVTPWKSSRRSFRPSTLRTSLKTTS